MIRQPDKKKKKGFKVSAND